MHSPWSIGTILTGDASTSHLGGWRIVGSGADPYGVLQAAGLLFFAFAGYARIATMGEEVVDPERTIPRAIPIALGLTVAIYLAVGTCVLLAAGPDATAHSTAPLATAVRAAGAPYAVAIVRIGAALASLGALLALIAGVGRTSLAMARGGDLPRWLAGVHPRYRVPHHAELVLALVVGMLVPTTDLRGVIGFSSFAVLTYYAIANASAFTQPITERRWPRAIERCSASSAVSRSPPRLPPRLDRRGRGGVRRRPRPDVGWSPCGGRPPA